MNRCPTLARRRLLAGAASVFVGGVLAGCSEQSNGADSGDGPTGVTAGSNSTTGSTTATDGPASETGTTDDDGSESTDESPLDLREANVVGVSFEGQAGSYTFDVTLHHDDAGEDGYANWWQIERLDGTRLGRRELLPAHSQQPFTRSGPIAIPEDVTCVVVRGHDQTHGYGGRVLLVNLDTAATRTIDQGPDRQGVDEADCP